MGIKSFVYELLYMRTCRFYARHFVRDKPADAFYRFMCSPQFMRTHHYWPDFVHPHRFSEKVWSRMLHDRSPLLTCISDKLQVRDYVTAKVGNGYLIPLLWSGENPEEIPFEVLPAKFVIKTNHGSGYVIIVNDKSLLDQAQVKSRLRGWLRENYCQDFFLGIEWGYKNVRPVILIESFLEEKGNVPVDYKFYCFSGRTEVLSLHFDRFVEHKTRSFDRNFQPHEFTYQFRQWDGECERPSNFDEMVQLAETLAQGFDFMRVDLYSVGNRVYFSELTPYPGGVSTKFLPARQDLILGEKWKMKPWVDGNNK